ncbi:MAG: O-antigen ligase family protein [Candidatus Omnitrophica bacterium]|nr:O-antigen ligase family protein [Candidatus Omnitrophota bacterium]
MPIITLTKSIANKLNSPLRPLTEKQKLKLQSAIWKIIVSCIFLYPLLPIFGSRMLDSTVNFVIFCSSLLYIFIFRKNIKKSFFNLIIIVFFLNLFGSALFVSDLVSNLNKVYDFFIILLLFYFAKLTPKNNQIVLIKTLLLSCCFVAIYSLWALFNNYFVKELLSQSRALAPFINPNLLAGYLIILIFISLGLLLQKKEEAKWVFDKYLAFFCVLISFIAFFFTKSIGGWLSLLSLLPFLLFWRKKINKKSITAILVIGLLSIIVFYLRLNNPEKITNPFFSIHQRVAYWRGTTEIIKQHPFVGVGLGNFYLPGSRYSHNSYLQIWGELGMIGILSWLVIVFNYVRMNLKILIASKNTLLSLAIFAAGLSFLLHNIVDFSFFIPQVAFLWWIILGLTTRKFTDISLNDHKNCSQKGNNQKN